MPDRVVSEKLVQILVFGCAYHRIVATTDVRRLPFAADATSGSRGWGAGAAGGWCYHSGPDHRSRAVADAAVDCCIAKALCSEKAGKSSVDRGKQGAKRSKAVDARGIPLGTVTAAASRHDSPLLTETLDVAVARPLRVLPERTGVHLDRSYDSDVTRERPWRVVG